MTQVIKIEISEEENWALNINRDARKRAVRMCITLYGVLRGNDVVALTTPMSLQKFMFNPNPVVMALGRGNDGCTE